MRYFGRPSTVPATLLTLLVVAVILAAVVPGFVAPATAQAAIAPPTTTTTVAPPPAKLPVFHLPYPAGMAFIVSQGNGGLFTHNPGGASEFAWDFDMPEGTPVVAAAAGKVVYISQDYQGGGFTDQYEGKANYVVLEHPDGLHSLYFHLAYQGVVVELGQQVAAGQIIAMSGNTGHSTGPHLHFEVQGSNWPNGAMSIPVTFAEAGVPRTGDIPLSANVLTPRAPAPRAAAPGLVLPGVPDDNRLRDVFTHQHLLATLLWAKPDQPVGPPGPSPPTVPVRLVAADSSGGRRVVAVSTAPTESAGGSIPGLDVIKGSLEVARVGWLTVWAEYDNGSGWSSLSDSAGRLVAATLRAGATDILVAGAGVNTTPPPAAPSSPGDLPTLTVKAGAPVTVSFTLINPATEVVHLFRVAASLVRENGSALPAADPSFVVTPAPRDLSVLAGESLTWSGTLTPLRPGTYVLQPTASDASFIALPLPPLYAESPTQVRLVVQDSGGPPVDPDAPLFSDVGKDNPAFSAVQALAKRRVVSGYPDPLGGLPLFRPDAPVSRAQFAKMIVGALGLPVSETDLCPFVDVPVSGPGNLYPDNFVAVAARAGLTLGVSVDPPLFDPYGNVTRGQALLMAERAAPGLDAGIPGDPWAPATRAEVATLLALLLRP